jgi:excisionase family DNA binding protein
MTILLTTREVARFLGINEKLVYGLIAEKGLPATKVTGKWRFPQHLVERWIEASTRNYPAPSDPLPPYHGLLVVTGSNDLLLERALSLFNASHPRHVAVFGNLGSMGGIAALRRKLCHLAASHLLQEDGQEYNFAFAGGALEQMPVVVNFCRREQGILLRRGLEVARMADLGQPGLRIVNRPRGTGTRLLFDRELERAGIDGSRLEGYAREVDRHLEVGLEILAGRADAGPAIRPVAAMLGLGFLPLRQERFDLLVPREHFFDQGVQLFLGLLHEREFHELAVGIPGYDTRISGKVLFPVEAEEQGARGVAPEAAGTDAVRAQNREAGSAGAGRRKTRA